MREPDMGRPPPTPASLHHPRQGGPQSGPVPQQASSISSLCPLLPLLKPPVRPFCAATACPRAPQLLFLPFFSHSSCPFSPLVPTLIARGDDSFTQGPLPSSFHCEHSIDCSLFSSSPLASYLPTSFSRCRILIAGWPVEQLPFPRRTATQRRHHHIFTATSFFNISYPRRPSCLLLSTHTPLSPGQGPATARAGPAPAIRVMTTC